MARVIKQTYQVDDKGSATVRTATKSINDSLDTVDKKSSDITKSMKTSWTSLVSIIGAAGLGLAFKNLITDTIGYADQLGKLNTRLGVNVVNMDKLRQVADLSGVTFETLTMAIQRMTRRLVDAEAGGGPAADAIKELGINVKDLANLTPDQKFLAIADALSKVDDGSQRVALAFKLFDSEGVKVLQMLPGLADGLENITSNMSVEKAKAAEQFNDQMTQLREEFQQLALETLPLLNKLLKLFADNIGLIAGSALSLVGIKLAAWFWGVTKSLIAMEAAFAGVGFLKWAKNLITVAMAARTVSGALAIVGTTALATSPALAGFLAFASNPWVLGIGAVLLAVGAAFLVLSRDAKRTADELELTKEQIEGLNEAVDRFKTGKSILSDEEVEQIRAYNNQINDLTSALNDLESRGQEFMLVPSEEDATQLKWVKTIDLVKQYQDEIAKLQEKINAILDPESQSEGISDETIKKLENNIKKVEELNERIAIRKLQLIGNEEEAEIKSMEARYEKFVEEAGKTAEQRKKINETLQLEIAAISKKYRDKELEAELEKQRELDEIIAKGVTYAIEAAEQQLAEETRINNERIAREKEIHDTILDEMNQLSMSEFDYQRLMLEKTYDEYAKIYGDISTLKEWYAQKSAEITNAEFEANKSALERWMDSAQTEYEQFEAIVIRAAESFSSGLADATVNWFQDWVNGVEDAEEAFKKFAATFLAEIAKMIIQQIILNSLKSWGWFPNEDGNVIDNGNVIPHARGGVVTGPTTFPMANGVGLMGEAGPEAIMPLTRGPNGKLGVTAQTDGMNKETESDPPAQYYINIQAMDSESFANFTKRNPSAIIGPITDAVNRGDTNVRNTLTKGVRS